MDVEYIIILCLIVLSIILNSIVVFVLVFHWKTLKNRDIIVLSLAVADLLKAVIGYPYLLTDYGRPPREGATPQCIISAFVITWASITTIAHLVMLSLTLYIALNYPYLLARLKPKVYSLVVFVLPCWLYGLLWAVMPLLGWSSYDKETSEGYRCAMNLREHTINVVSYNVCLLLVAFAFPLVIALICFVNVTRIFKTLTETAANTNGTDSSMDRETRRQEHSIYVLNMIMFSAFVLAWFPYASFVIMTVFKHEPSQRLFDIAAILAKTSSFYNPIIYAFAYKQFRTKAKRVLCRRKKDQRNKFETKTEV